jgi:hypothetical protein
MHPVLVGSRAAKVWFPDFRQPKDWDYFASDKQAHGRPDKVETFYHPDLEQWSWDDIATANELYTIKVSHAFWANRWPKHIQDTAFLQSKGCKLIPELFDILYPIWVEHYGRKRARLVAGTKPEEFFTPTVQRKYDHDSLHASVAYYEEPLFNAILRDGEAVAVDRHKFDALSYDDKCRLVREEVYATALERKVIPSNYTESPLRAYRWALEQTVTSYSKGWFPLWIVQNVAGLLKPDVDYVQRHIENAHKLILLGD